MSGAARAATTEIPHSRTVLAEEDINAAIEVLRSGQVNESEVTRELERTAAEMLGREHSWATAGGTPAVFSALVCMGVGDGDEVLIPTYICDDVLSAVLQTGATPVPVDIDPDDLNPDPADVKAKAGPTARAVIAAHNLGMPARVGELAELGMPLIEDCAHGLGGELGGAPAGSEGHCTVLSFHGLKMVHAGEGGMVLTDDQALFDVYRAKCHPDFAAGEARLHSRMSNVLAAIAISQFGRLSETVERRRGLAARYREGLNGLPVRPAAGEAEGRRSSGYRFAVVMEAGATYEEAERAFKERGVIVRRPVKQLCHRSLGLDPGDWPRAEELFDRIVSLPLYPNLSTEEQDKVIAAAAEVFA